MWVAHCRSLTTFINWRSKICWRRSFSCGGAKTQTMDINRVWMRSWPWLWSFSRLSDYSHHLRKENGVRWQMHRLQMITYWNTCSMSMRQRLTSMPVLTEFCSSESSTCTWTLRIFRSLKKHECADSNKIIPMDCFSLRSPKRKSKSSFGANLSRPTREKNQSLW